MAVHLTPDEIAVMLEAEPDAVVEAAQDVDVPVFQGRIDRVLLAEALGRAGHPLAPVARERLLRDGDVSG
ncbi:hypothetical protein [Miltoncostaea marina]|uniref:hypothetical protein n=1 Tax=Miltoncostaea marina TaxID=2843215 RepID=UPI001C3D8C79|nr:hypothetical protein [Miltoncostaea marina]